MARADGGPVLSRRVLNRTLLQRQGLSARTAWPPLEVVERLVGLQAQEPRDPYVALWTRIDGFDPDELARALIDRRAVRMGLQRSTLHLVTAADARSLYPVMRDVHVRGYRGSSFARALGGIDLDTVADAARELLERSPLTPSELGRRLAERWPDRDPTALAYTARYLLPLVQVPPRGLWRQSGRTANTTAEHWLGGPLGPAATLDAVVRRYLAAFGPASPADLRTWSGWTGLGTVVTEMLADGRLRTFRDEAGRRLVDSEEATLAAPDLPAPVRLLPQYDNVFLSHADRSRINGTLSWGLDFVGKGPILVDGFIEGTWRLRTDDGVATMTVEIARGVDAESRAELEREALALLGFLASDAAVTDVRIVMPS